MGKESSGTALTVPATGLPVGEQGKEYGKTPTAPMRATEGAPEGCSWSGAEAVPALGSSCRVSMEEQAGGMPAESRRWEVAPTILDVSRNSREGFSSDVDVSQYREGCPPGVGSVALPGLRQDAPSRHSYQRGQMPGLSSSAAQASALAEFDADVLAASSQKSEKAHRRTLVRNLASGMVHAALRDGQARCSWTFTVGVTAEVVSGAPVLHNDLCERYFPWLRGDRMRRLGRLGRGTPQVGQMPPRTS